MTEALTLVVVAWLVYVSDALWWLEPERVVLYGHENGRLRAQLGPTYTLRGDSGVFVPRLVPPFQINFEVDVAAAGPKRSEQTILGVAQGAVDAARPLHRLGVLLWSYCFVVAPIVIVMLGLQRVWLPVLLVLITLAIAVIRSFARRWRVLRPDNPGGWKEHALPMILSPVAAIGAGDSLTRVALASFDGLAVVAALATREDFVRIARLYYFAPHGEVRNETASRLESLIDDGLRAAILEAPSPVSDEMKGYCQRCHTQLVRENGDCPECRHPGIVPFPVATPSGAFFDTSRSAARR